MGELSFRIDSKALALVNSTEITANFDEMRAGLEELVRPYENLIVTEDGIASAKNDRATLRKYSKSIDDYRKVVKKQASEPYMRFEEKCKELIAIIDRGSDNLDRQVKEYEEERKQEKLARLKNYFGNAPKEYPEYIRWEDIINPKWANVTYAEEEAQSEISNQILRNDYDIKTLKARNSEFELSLLERYRECRNLYECIDYDEKLTERKRIQDEQRRAAEERRMQEERARELERQAAIEAEYQRQMEREAMASEQAPDIFANAAPKEEEKKSVYSISVACTDREFSSILSFLNSSGIEVKSTAKTKKKV